MEEDVMDRLALKKMSSTMMEKAGKKSKGKKKRAN